MRLAILTVSPQTARVRNAGRDHVAIADRLDLLKAVARDNAIKARE
jgi:hypothetical protein